MTVVKPDVIKRQLNNGMVLERKTLVRRHVLKLDDERCIGCGICKTICPKDAIKQSSAVTREGKLVQKPRIDFDEDKCIFCGECVDLCPMNAIVLEINGEQRIPVFEAEAFPILRRLIAIDAKKCWWGSVSAACNIECKNECPTDAIEVSIQRIGKESTGRIVDFKVLEEECIFCRRCEIACPEEAIYVIKPFRGSLQLDRNLCPEGCQICADACPSEALSMDEDNTLVNNEEFCIYCGACQQVCPEEAIKIKRTEVLHSDVKSGAWGKALEKLTSLESLVKEMNRKSVKKRRVRVRNLAFLK